MKKYLAILSLVVFLFNTIGYKAVFYAMEQQAATHLEAEMDQMAETGKTLLTVKIPINLPYQTNWKDYERVDGEMTYKGITYKYFKRKIYNDSLILVCVAFNEKNTIRRKSDDYYKKVNDLTTESNKKQSIKQLKQDDYYTVVVNSPQACIHINRLQVNYIANPDCNAGYPDTILMPPRQTFI
ncbi:hypothetical protein BDD43_0919 [Mucilaginibacter gracilis]|uniref:Uncharacterized protein n=1 Tax=Mucilaginibacter gracilis TaxID=423350 RepID=A0A495IVK7_9SPHI|nr:hypothetical protein [Mucilaginibacter gracilis]RKR80785.1 hypothetical protein BDD43_0919 [Mucilaginibacter gracilis]